MKTVTEVKARIAELAAMLKQGRCELEAAKTIEQIDQIAAKNRRLEGNIGALEWVVRQ